MPVLHVVVPFYNERETLEQCLRRTLAVTLPDGWSFAAHLVDDHSEAEACAAAGTLVGTLVDDGHAVTLQRHEVNRGKGAAVQTAFDAILVGDADDDDLVIIQDADLEYDPADFTRLMAPILAGEASAVIGSRWGEHAPPRSLKRRVHAWGNRALTRFSNLMTGFAVRDMECCYKLVTVALLRRLRPLLDEQRFGIEPQIVAALARLRERVVEVPVSYEPRNFEAGKKIGWIDGVRALYVIMRERLRPAPPEPPR
jgi:glycosyltransferase involved in cell wall biosynthesis